MEARRELVFLSAAPNDLYFYWQYRVLLNNFRKYGMSNKVQILIWKHSGRAGNKSFQKEWDSLINDFPESAIYFYEDQTGELSKVISSTGYIPLLRPWLLSKHFQEFPELKDKAIFYHDSDICFTKKPNFDKFLDDDVCYLSDTRSYIAASYFDSKVKDVLPEKLEAYKQIDPLQEVLDGFGLNRSVAEANEKGSGGAQYILKNVDSKFWQDVFTGCIEVRNRMGLINRKYFANEDKGFQRWAADMWSVLFNLWKREKVTQCPSEMDFCWATDPIEKWDQVQIYHDAGASTRPIKEGHRLFHKRDLPYVNNERTPFEDDLSFVSEEYCSKNYVKEIEEVGGVIGDLVENVCISDTSGDDYGIPPCTDMMVEKREQEKRDRWKNRII